MGVIDVVHCDWDDAQLVMADAEDDLPYSLDEDVRFTLVAGHGGDDCLSVDDGDV